jgi:hypothetical protein
MSNKVTNKHHHHLDSINKQPARQHNKQQQQQQIPFISLLVGPIKSPVALSSIWWLRRASSGIH